MPPQRDLAAKDNVNRNKARSPAGSSIFVGLRALDPFLQHSLLSNQLGATIVEGLGGKVFSQGPTANTGLAMIDSLGLSPYRLALLCMAAGSSIKQIFWQLIISEQEMPPKDAAKISFFNTVFNTSSSLVFIAQATSPAYGLGEGPAWAGWPSTPLVVGSSLFVLGMLVETISEIQRHNFKKNPENKGRLYTGGLFSLARHINYGGYTTWRAGYALAAGGWTWGAIVGGFFFYDFAFRGVPVLDEYCSHKVCSHS